MRDVIIIGAGPAGITLSNFLDKSLDALIIEEGSKNYIKTKKFNFFGNSKKLGNFPYKNYSVNYAHINCYGGTSKVWSGWLKPFPKDSIKSWGISYKDINKYLKKTNIFLGLKDFNILRKKINKKFNNFFLNDFILEQWQYNRKVFLKKKVKHKILYNTKLLKVVLKKNKVDHILVNQNGVIKKLYSKKFIFSMGGISTTFNLLKIKNKLNQSVGNTYTEHPHLAIGYIKTKKNLDMFLRHKINNVDMRTGLFYKKNKNINAFSITIDNNKFVFSRSALALQYLLRLRSIPMGFFKNYPLNKFLCDLFRDLWDLIKIKFNDKKIVVLRFEQELNDKSKIRLLKNGKISLNWCLSYKDYKLIDYSINKFKKFVKKNKIGNFYLDKEIENLSKSNPKNISLLGIGHHMSTTRMSISKKKGLVNKNLMVNKINNLFICSSSVFPSVSSENPTYMISFLAIRLADYLNKILNR